MCVSKPKTQGGKKEEEHISAISCSKYSAVFLCDHLQRLLATRKQFWWHIFQGKSSERQSVTWVTVSPEWRSVTLLTVCHFNQWPQITHLQQNTNTYNNVNHINNVTFSRVHNTAKVNVKRLRIVSYALLTTHNQSTDKIPFDSSLMLKWNYPIKSKSNQKHLYSAIRRKRIRGAWWRWLDKLGNISYIKQFGL